MGKSGGTYEPQAIEAAIYERWERGGYFHADADPARRPFTVVIPPPNVTGALHLGHALNNSLQDAIIRRKRMQGFNACWLPGTDHAGIATQAVVEKRLLETEGKTRNEIGRETLVERIWNWKDEYEARILGQLRRLGCSCDWERTRFTLDERCAKAVYEAFFRLFRDGFIYRGERLVNWDAQLQTAVADDEVYHETVKGHLWHIRYTVGDEATERRSDEGEGHGGTEARRREGECGHPARESGECGHPARESGACGHPARESGECGHPARESGACGHPARNEEHGQPARDSGASAATLTIATTRPETMLGDTALAVHPDDPRYKHLIGKQAILPLVNRRIPIIGDPILVDPHFGTGVVKVTPGHDPKDYQCGLRNHLPLLNILTKDGRIREDTEGKQLFGVYAGLERYAARKQIVKDLEAGGFLEKAEPYEHDVGHSDRSKTPIEPMLSEQWFVKMDKLAEAALEAVRDGRVRFYPERYAKTYLDWLGEKRDWCISRQLWWGHRIPVWTEPSDLVPFGFNTPFYQELQTWIAEGRLASIITAESQPVVALTAYPVPDEKNASWKGAPWVENLPVSKRAYCPSSDFADEFSRIASKHRMDQDSDVLDTWFSSALWPFSTFGWPAELEEEPAHQASAGGSASQPTAGKMSAAPNAGETPVAAIAGETPAAAIAGETPALPAVANLSYFYPGAVLSTARDIITLWVARMVMSGLYCLGRVPFSQVYVHPVIQDGNGRRMSKSIGNGVDPLDLIQMYGTDAMRYTLVSMAGETQDVRIPISYSCPHCQHLTPHSGVVPHNKVPRDIHKVKCKGCGQEFATVWAPDELKQQLSVGPDTSERFELGRNFVNKLWQAATGLVIPRLSNQAAKRPNDGGMGGAGIVPADSPVRALARGDLAAEDRWILSRLQACIAEVDRRLDAYQFSDAVAAMYAFFWGELCDWYLELAKPRLGGGDDVPVQRSGARAGGTDGGGQTVRQVLAFVLDQTLGLLHPVIPFVTEELWSRLNEAAPWRGIGQLEQFDKPLIVSAWPTVDPALRDPQAEAALERMQNVIRALRDVKARVNGIRAAARQTVIRTLPRAVVRAEPAIAAELAASRVAIQTLGMCDEVEIGPSLPKPADSAGKVFPGYEVYISLTGLADLELERRRLHKEIDETRGHAQRTSDKLANDGFVRSAPPPVVERERARLSEMQEKLRTLEENLAQIGG